MRDHQPSAGTPREDDAAGRELSIDEAFAIALYCQQSGQLSQAELLFAAILKEAPDRADALHHMGILAHQQGRSEEAVRLIGRSLDLRPDDAAWHNNLGIVRQGQGDVEGALTAYERAVALDPRHANAINNRGVLLKVRGDLEGAEASYRAALEIDPAHADACQNLAMLLSVTKRVPEAVKYYCRALTLRPGAGDARRLLAMAYCVIGEREKAVALCEEWVAQEPEDPIARHTLAACSGRDVPPRASDGYIVKAFDRFSETFEAKLAQLEYRAPALVVAAVEVAGLGASGGLDVLDAGCGTGLCGPLLRAYARRLVGVDLSQGMLDHAARKGAYDELVKGELTAYLQGAPASFDLVVSADTLVYFGPLEEVAAAAAAALRPGGLLVFTLEEAEWADAGVPHAIQTHGRYNHRYDYVERVLSAAGLQPEIARAELRLESGLPVKGLVVRGTKPPAGGAARGAAAVGVSA